MVHPVVSSDETFHSELKAALEGEAHFAQTAQRRSAPDPRGPGMAALSNGIEEHRLVRPWLGQLRSLSTFRNGSDVWSDANLKDLEMLARAMVADLMQGLQQDENGHGAPCGLLPTLDHMWVLQQDLILKSKAQLEELEEARQEVRHRRLERDQLAEEASSDALRALDALGSLCNSNLPVTSQQEASKDQLVRLLHELRELREECGQCMLRSSLDQTASEAPDECKKTASMGATFALPCLR